jgi:O-antigen/teichoic acid export membrane protein
MENAAAMPRRTISFRRFGAAGRRTAREPGTRLAGYHRNLLEHLTSPLLRNGYALMLNTGVTGLLGVAYWLLAAHRYSAADVGRASAAFAALNLLSGITAHNMLGALTRFIPQSGRRTKALIIRSYLVSAVASMAAAVLFLLTVRRWGASYSDLTGLVPGLLFIGCVAAWAIFTLQDGVLTGLRGGVWVPAENGLFGIVKIVLLVVLATSLPRSGIDLSWMAPVVLSLPLVNALIFGRLMPRHERLTADHVPPTPRQIGRFLAGDYTGNLCMLAVSTIVPVAVAARIGPGMNAYFYMAWTIGGTLDLLAINMATSLTVEGAFDQTALAANCRMALRRTLLVLAPIAAGLVWLAPWVLGLFGPAYAAHGAAILRLLGLAILPKALIELYLGVLRAQNRTARVALIQAARGLLMLGLTLTLTGTLGVAGAGVAVLASQALVALMTVPGLRRVLSVMKVLLYG